MFNHNLIIIILASFPDPATVQAYQSDKNHILLSWTPGNPNGATVVSYLVQCFRNDSFGTVISETVPATQTSVLIDQLIPEVYYVVSVITQSSDYGSSEASAPVTVGRQIISFSRIFL